MALEKEEEKREEVYSEGNFVGGRGEGRYGKRGRRAERRKGWGGGQGEGKEKLCLGGGEGGAVRENI